VSIAQRLFGLLLVKEHERGQVLYYLLLFFVLGAGLALGRGSMDALFLKRFGFQYLPVMYGVLSVFMATLSLGYAAWVDRLPSERFFQILLGVLGAMLVGCWIFMQMEGMSGVYPLYFLIYEFASELLLMHATLYISQNLETQELKRLSPIIFAGAQAGTVAGGLFLALAAKAVGVSNMLLVWTVLIAACIVLLYRRHRVAGMSPYFRPGRKGRGGLRQSVDQVTAGVRFFRRSELARASSFALFFMVMAFFVLSYAVSRIYAQTFPDADSLGAFYGWLTAFTSASALVLQLFVTNRLLQRLGVKQVNFVFPVAAILSYVALLVSFTLPAALLASFTRDAINPAIRRPARNLYQNALQESMQGRVRALSVALVMPAALLAVSLLLVLAQRSFQPAYFLAGGLAACLLYVYYKMRVNRTYDSTLMATLRDRLFLPGRALTDITSDGGLEVHDELARGVDSPDEEVSLAYARLLCERFPDQAAPFILQRLQKASLAAQDRYVRVLADCRGDFTEPLLRLQEQSSDDHLRATVLELLFTRRDPRAVQLVPSCLASANPRLAAIGIFGVESYGLTDFQAEAVGRWEALLDGASEGERVAAAGLFVCLPESPLRARLAGLLQDEAPAVRKAALAALAHLPAGALPQIGAVLAELYAAGDVETRTACVGGYRMLPADDRYRMCIDALEDPHPQVRDVALAQLLAGEGEGVPVAGLVEWLRGNRGSPRAQRAALEALSRHHASRVLFEQLAETKANDAECYAEILSLMGRLPGSTAGAPKLLRIVLEERRAQMIDLTLAAMENLENPLDVATIRAGLAARDRRFRGQAAEALRGLRNRTLADRLGHLLDGSAGPHPRFHELRDAFGWLQERADSWVRECAHEASIVREGGHV